MALLPNPTAVVTGAGGGLGRALCLALAPRGGQTIAADLDRAAAEETARQVRAAGGRAEAVRCDVTRAEEVEGLAALADERFGGADLVVNNAGVAVAGPVGTVPLEDWRWIVDVNLWGVVHCCHAFVPRLRARKRGHVLNVASAAGLLSLPRMAPYNVTKAAVVALSETLAGELRGTGVGVTVLCPTFFTTGVVRSGRTHGPDDPARIEKWMARAKVQAPEVAQAALAACDAGTLYALPHADGRWFWRFKRAAPGSYHGRVVPAVMRLVSRSLQRS